MEQSSHAVLTRGVCLDVKQGVVSVMCMDSVLMAWAAAQDCTRGLTSLEALMALGSSACEGAAVLSGTKSTPFATSRPMVGTPLYGCSSLGPSDEACLWRSSCTAGSQWLGERDGRWEGAFTGRSDLANAEDSLDLVARAHIINLYACLPYLG